MIKLLIKTVLVGLLGLTASGVIANPEADKAAFQKYFQGRFPVVVFQEFANGIYAVDSVSRAKWVEIEQFPPYEIAIEAGQQHYTQAFTNGKNYADCLPDGGLGVAQSYPKYDDEQGTVLTLALLINQCRLDNGEKALEYSRGEMANLLAYLVYTSRDKTIDIVVQNDAAKAAYRKGKQFYYARRGQLNMACAHCHVDNAGMRMRENIISPALGQVSGFPAYRSAWGEVGTLHRRFADCNEQVLAKPFAAQSEAYKNLEYFLSYMSNGIKVNGPSTRQ